MEIKKLTAKDFITIGIFTAIWFVTEKLKEIIVFGPN